MTIEEVHSYIASRCAQHGLSLEDGLSLTHPAVLANASPDELYKHWKSKEISHILADKTHPELKGDVSNYFLEDRQENRSRQENPATPEEVQKAFNDQLEDYLDQDYNDNDIPDILDTPIPSNIPYVHTTSGEMVAINPTVNSLATLTLADQSPEFIHLVSTAQFETFLPEQSPIELLI